MPSSTSATSSPSAILLLHLFLPLPLTLPTHPHNFLLTRRNPLFLLSLLLLILGIVRIARDTFHKLPSISFAILGRPLLLPIFLQRARLARENIHGPLVGLVRSILDFGMKAPLSACSTAYSRASPIRTARQGIVSRCAGGDARDFRNAPHCFAPRTPLPFVFLLFRLLVGTNAQHPVREKRACLEGQKWRPHSARKQKKERTGQGGPTTTPLCTALGRRRTHRSNIGRGVGASHQERLDPVKSSFHLFSVLGRMYGCGVVSR